MESLLSALWASCHVKSSSGNPLPSQKSFCKANNSVFHLTGENAILHTLGKSVKLKDAQQCSYLLFSERRCGEVVWKEMGAKGMTEGVPALRWTRCCSIKISSLLVKKEC